MTPQLGILPLLIAAGATLAAGTGGYFWKQNSDYEAWKKTVPPPAPPPVRRAPSNPIEMTDPRAWSPEVEQQRYRATWDAWRASAIPDNADTLNPNDNDGLIIAAVVVAAAAVWSLRK